MAKSYKSLKEDFVSNLSGGSVSEINYVTAVAPAAVLLWSALQSRQSYFVNYGAAAFSADSLLNVGAILLAITLYSSNPVLLNVLLISPSCLLYLLPAKPARQKVLTKPDAKEMELVDLDPLPIRPFITSYRGAMMVVTCTAILAVDFKIFPRRFAKVENWGTSLMDMGVGSFVFSAGLVSARPILKDRLLGKVSSLGSMLYISTRRSLPLIALGLIRLYSVKGLEYAEHTTEYGVHWNFFFTLALLPPAVAVFETLSTLIPSVALLALLLSAVYQTCLEFTTLKAYILTAPRDDLLSKNREGVFSFIGYLAVFLAGQSAGFTVLNRHPSGSSSTTDGFTRRKLLVLRLVSWSVGWSVLFYLANSYSFGLNLRVSRRLANLPYVLWVSAFNCTQITIFCIIETLVFPRVCKALDKNSEVKEVEKATSTVLKAFNRNALAIFLVANLLTGLVNLTLDTLSTSRGGAIAMLVAYSAVLTTFAVALDHWNISIKL